MTPDLEAIRRRSENRRDRAKIGERQPSWVTLVACTDTDVLLAEVERLTRDLGLAANEVNRLRALIDAIPEGDVHIRRLVGGLVEVSTGKQLPTWWDPKTPPQDAMEPRRK